MNVDFLIYHFNKVARLIEDNNIDPKRLVNVDETGFFLLGRDSTGSKNIVFTLKGERP